VGDKRFSMEEVMIVAVNLFSVILLCINSIFFPMEKRSEITYRILALEVPASKEKRHTEYM